MEVRPRNFSNHKPLTLDIPLRLTEDERLKEIVFKSTENRNCVATVSVSETEQDLSIIYTFKKRRK